MKSSIYKWFLLILLSGAFFFHQADRALFGLLTIPIQNELELTDVQIGWINTVLSWTLGIMAFGVCGFALGILFIFALRDEVLPAQPANRERRTSYAAGLVYFLKTPSAWCAMAGFVAIVFANNAYLFWAPKFMAVKFGSDVGAAGTQTMLWHHLFAFAAIIAGGLVSDRFVRRFPRFRLGFQIGALLVGAPCLCLIGILPSAVAMVAMTAVYGICRGKGAADGCGAGTSMWRDCRSIRTRASA